jgi:hypothetical protein
MRLALRVLGLLLLLPPVLGAAQEKKKYKLLFITQSKGFKHGSVNRKDPAGLAPAEVSVTEIGKESGLFEAECSQDASVLTPEKLKDVDVVMFYTTGALPIPPPNFDAFLAWLKAGKAFVGTHSATDTFGNFEPYWRLINGTFAGHPWGSGETVTLVNHDPSHPAVRMLGEEFQFKDEIYQYTHYDPKAVRVLYSLNMAKCKTKMPYHVPVCWVRKFEKGRVFYTNLGHNEGTWQNPKFKEHLLAGIRWALKLEEGSAVPNPEVQALEGVLSFLAVAAGEAGKNYDELAAVAKAAAKDAAWLQKVLAEIAALRKIDAKKDPDRRKAELIRILGEIDKKRAQ